jgi:hypothetical protein
MRRGCEVRRGPQRLHSITHSLEKLQSGWHFGGYMTSRWLDPGQSLSLFFKIANDLLIPRYAFRR